jgi:apocytochrome f|uniref:Cytochrome f n=1 Tax=Poterioochromonas malhamensis TaxID=88167 RepID=A0A7T7BWC5_9STRA|nr:apocytochrome f of cytochrome b6/f complex [Poterioochromonas malhamensis]QQK55036.1 apocytochrome f of cytochrome b6/f complex [Poterioochromonas malhamensis]
MKNFFKLLINCFIFSSLSSPFTALESLAFPIYAQQNYENPREANGKIVCANCHLAQKPVELETPKSILPNTIFETLVKIPLKKDSKQILSNGNTGELNIGAVLILPEEFKLAPKNRLTEKLQTELKNVYITPYSSKYENILVVGPISAKKSNEIIFPILSPDPESNKKIHYLKYPIYVGANRGRGQLYPNGEKTNNNVVTSSIAGKVSKINFLEKNTEVQILDKNGNLVSQLIPKNIQVIVKENQAIVQDQALTINPNVGGFGQTESEIVLQNSERIYFYTVFCLLIILTQSIFVLKKKQFEKVQLAEMDF